MFTPELLSPAGSLKNMRYAFAYGADAVYAGQPRYSLRVRNNEFNHENLAKGINEAHELGKKFYVVVNIAPHNAKLKTFIRDLTPVIEMGPDALIMSDPGLIMMVREAFPEMDIHLSVQANAVNWASVKFWKQMGLTRVILSRELSLEEIAEIRQQVPEIELEVFVHGALCMAYSGRCLLSGYINKRDPNQGTCTNACRWEYKVQEGKEDDVGNIVHVHEPIPVKNVAPTLGEGAPTDKVYMIEEAMRPGEYMTAFEDEHGTYIMNSKDLRAIEHVETLTKMGVHSLKIEGRTKSFYYCARTAQVYRRAIDDAVAGKPFDPTLLSTLEGLAHRGYTEGFLRRHTHDAYQTYEYGYSVSDTQQFVGEFTGNRVNGLAEVDVKNKFSVGDSLELMTPSGNIVFTLDALTNRKGESIEVAPGNGHVVYLPIPEDVDVNFGLLIRNLAGTTTRDPHQAQEEKA
ncbi:tRNA 5-hydroxyuridine modification protein YegQ [Providencia sp. JGM181]|jgi:putative protease|uniref:prephenate-dependent tRNA uridine(34) hydroxylase TrhP n=1 Tax=unclassified Providencia TaxID=2633465 RepID=UPI0012B67435|nr:MULTISPECIES: tRNA 5-hydroxyuridine modification protein YegQ [unclassified Providencia]MBC5790726.1 tRNA 5-hydroxyuridine modification protein YegQ [Providencia sp. JUb39]MBS0924560.1 tRNA 5-hydroxyuridine modification protein YegQ [Providencia sp. JGM181]MBS0932799.1 tRNA 5-hydroxyuridine modification protein YegQ [Providencia sp. JGM172]MBS0996992.1 tRNA 5-hydroxyuridine modification protein YegQ [Providencia sp. JGM178]MTC41019.1 tRNA 5-hydroxyuridine modification protein YegQ [Providen